MSSLSISLAEQTKSQAFLEVGKKVAAVFTAAVVSLPNGGSSLSPIAQYVGEVQQVCQYQSQGIEPVTPAYNGITVSLTESVPMLESSRNIQKLREFGEYKANWNGYGAEAFDTLAADDTNYKGTVVVSPSELVSSTYQVISDYFDGKDVEPLVNIKLNLCTKDNVSEYQSEE